MRERPRLKPGDTFRDRMTEDGVPLDKAPANQADNPFATFSEWSNEADEKAHAASRFGRHVDFDRLVAPVRLMRI